ncbi:hypothetical protein ONS96_005336 [Cadophora gregata f. sp. sojae]|nr:hypothetical protein ONS96_005336 [Cadophora gregata f. sp. sojae]
MRTGLSEWARKYGASTEIRSNPPERRSGLTPISRIWLSQFPMSEEDERLAEENELFQRRHLFEFTTQELKDLDVISERKFGPSTIQAHVAPFWSRENWYDGKVSANGALLRTYPLPAPYFNSRWVGTDEVVWALLQPIITLASKILVESPRVTNFLNNLIERSEELIDPGRIPRWDPMRPDSESFNELTLVKLKAFIGPQEEYRMATKRAALFRELARCLTIAFKIDSEDTISGEEQPEDKDIIEAATEGDYEEETKRFRHVFTFLDCEMLVPLLGTHLNGAERFGLILWVAMTLFHESIHAMWHLIYSKEKNRYAHIEPYIEEDQLMEIGAAMEVRAFGGFMKPMWNPRPGPVTPNLGFWVEPGFPKTFDMRRRHPSSAVLRTPKMPSQVLAIPVPVSLFEDIHSEDFWSAIMRAFGVSLFKLRVVNQASEATQTRRGVTSVSKVTAFERVTLSKISSAVGTRFTGRNDLNKCFWRLVRDFNAMDPAKRQTMEVAFAIKRSLEAVDQYWDSCQQLSTLGKAFASNNHHISQLLATLTVTSTDRDKNRWLQLLRDQVNIVEQAVREHEGQVQAAETVAASRSFLDEERRGVLRAWNYDTRIFLRSVGKYLSDDIAAQSRINTLENRLETTRVRSWHYLEPSAINSNDNRELLNLRELWDTRVELRSEGRRITPVLDKCLELLNTLDPGYSLYYFLALNILYAHGVAFSNERGRFREALASLEMVDEHLIGLLNADRQPPHWKPVLQGWCDAAIEAFEQMTTQAPIIEMVVQDPLLKIGKFP